MGGLDGSARVTAAAQRIVTTASPSDRSIGPRSHAVPPSPKKLTRIALVEHTEVARSNIVASLRQHDPRTKTGQKGHNELEPLRAKRHGAVAGPATLAISLGDDFDAAKKFGKRARKPPRSDTVT